MCCLKYEEEAYLEKLKKLPKVGATVLVPEEGEGIVDSVQTLKEIVRVKFKDKDGFFYKKFKAEDIKVTKDVQEQDELEGVDNEELKELKKLEKLEEQDKLSKDAI